MDKKKILNIRFMSPVVVCLLVVFSFVFYYFFTAMTVPAALADGANSTHEGYQIYIDSDDDIDSVMAKIAPFSTKAGLNGFSILARHLGYESRIRPGMYIMKDGVCAFSFIRKLRNGQQDPIMLTVPTARIMPELAKRLDKKLESDSAAYMKAFTDSAKIAQYGFKKETLPAMIIPNTYDFFWTDTPEKFLDRMNKEYKKFWNDERLKKAKKIGLSPLQVSILASIVDGETNIESDKPKLACVYLNRLKKGMKLQACPTVKFALGDFTIRRVLNKHLCVDSPYNTYKYEGLPPGPISIPTIVAIDAVLNPSTHDYLFFCASPAFDGTHAFAKTEEEHLRNARAYQAALNARHIK